MKYLILLFCLVDYLGIQAQNTINLDLDHDGKPDQVYLTSTSMSAVKLVVNLSSLNDKKVTSLEISNPDGFFSLHADNERVELDYHLDYVERMKAYFQYDRVAETLVLVKMERSVDGDNDINEAGRSTLDIGKQQYLGEWTYYDYADADPELYRIDMPNLLVKMEFPKVQLNEFDEKVFWEYRKKCKQQYQKQLQTIFPKGNTFVNGEFHVDLNNDYSSDVVYLDTYTSRLVCTLSTADGSVEITIDPTGFYADDNFEISPLDDHFVLTSSVDDQRVDFDFDELAQKFIILNPNPNNLINSDLDDDGVIDSVQVIRVDDQLQIVCQLSSQGFQKVKSGLFYGVEAKVDRTSPNLLLELFFERSGVNALFEYDKKTQTMNLAILDSWYMYDDVNQELNMKTGEYKASKKEEDSDDEIVVNSTIQLPTTMLADFDDQFLAKYYEKTSEVFDKVAFHQYFDLAFSVKGNFLSLYMPDPVESDLRFKGCSISFRITDERGHTQDFFVSKTDLAESSDTFYDNEIYYSKQLGYYIEDGIAIFPKGIKPGLYQVQAVIAHPDFLEDEVSNVVEYRIKK